MARIAFRLLSLAAWTLSSLAAAGPGPQNNDQLKDALHAVLVHGDLADLPQLSANLGIGLRLLRPESRLSAYARACCRAIATANPPALIASGLQWEAGYSELRNDTRIDLTFVPRTCFALNDWAKDWRVHVEHDDDPHGAASFQTVHWPGASGITLSLTELSDGTGCNVRLMQFKSGPLTLSPPPSVDPPSGGFSALQIVQIAKSGDLRDYETVAKILATPLRAEPGSVRDHLLYHGHLQAGEVVPGLNPAGFEYFGNDSGWEYRPSFVYQPQHLAERAVTLQLEVDIEARCISTRDVEQEIDKQHVERSTKQPNGVYEIEGEHRINFGFQTVNGCVARVGYKQVTDAAEHISVPVIFFAKDSLRTSDNGLTEDALRKLDLLTKRVKALPERSPRNHPVRLQQISISTCEYGADAGKSGATDRLVETITRELLARNPDLSSAQIRQKRGNAVQLGMDCSSLEGEKSHMDFVALDAWAD
jgi:hypothetical protein